MGQGIHTGIGNLLRRKGRNQIRVHNGDIRRDFKVSQRIFNSLGVIGDNGESSYLCGSTGCCGDCTEESFCTELREVEGNNQFLKGGIRMLVECPHGLGRINRGAASDCDDPVRSEFLHGCCAFHNGFNGRIRFHTLKETYFHACFF